jgi:hypothetical protein
MDIIVVYNLLPLYILQPSLSKTRADRLARVLPIGPLRYSMSPLSAHIPTPLRLLLERVEYLVLPALVGALRPPSTTVCRKGGMTGRKYWSAKTNVSNARM